MTFNVLGRAGDPYAVLDTIQAEAADLVFLQEITPDMAWLIEHDLAEAYPYQLLEPDMIWRGMGVISRYPLRATGVDLEGEWTADPQVLEMEWMGQTITLVNMHTQPTSSLWPGWVHSTFDQREADIAHLTDFIANLNGPVIVGGDANMTQLNTAYRVLTHQVRDVWRLAGSGLGHTFPGPVEAGQWATRVGHFLIPPWLVRIDYLFISDDWQPTAAWLAEFHGGSDHRGVVAELTLVVENP
jgi:endonuclease/exonuclease/phosphatase (EEP) superfamily protein YafD